MAKLRRSPGPAHGLSPMDAPRPAGQRRWVVLAGLVLAGLLALAWFDGGEQPLRPMEQAVELPEVQP